MPPTPTSSLESDLSQSSLENLLCWLSKLNIYSQASSQLSNVATHDTISTFAIKLNDRALKNQLQAAKSKLRVANPFHLMKVTAYLRACCAAIQKGFPAEVRPYPDNLFLTLIQSLVECEPEWWKQCEITGTYRLTSDNACIQELLNPLEDFVQRFTEV